MDGQGPQNRNRNTYMVFIAAGLFILLHKLLNPGTVIALFLLALGVYAIRSAMEKKGFILLAIGAILLIGSHLTIVMGLLFISLGFFYMKSRQIHGQGNFYQKTKLIASFKRTREPWIMRNMSLWQVVGELNLDFTLAIPEEKQITMVLQGIVGDIDILVPEDMGLSVETSLLFGQLSVGREQESGVMNKIHWRSPHYDENDQKVKLIVSFLVGDINIKVI